MSAATLILHKYHGVGNDFLVNIDPAVAGLLDGALARAACDRHRGIGADGLISAVAAPDTSGFHFQLWNADGSDAEMSGNGIRCAAHALLDASATEWWSDEQVELSFATAAGPRVVTARSGPEPTIIWASVAMGVVSLRGPAQRCNVGHGQLEVDLGNPHLVVLGPDPATVDVAGLGAALDAAVACGTGSCAAAAAMHHWGRTGRAVTVHQPGGSVAVQLAEDGTALLSGPSQRIARCEWSRGEVAVMVPVAL
jgi:diaminopimelate epimerase